MNQTIRVVLPRKYDLVVGDTFQLFYRGVVEAPNPYVYDILAVCPQGRNFPRYFELTPQQPGEFTLQLYVFSPDRELLGYGETCLKVSAAVSVPEPLHLLCIGDSLTAGGLWPWELHRRLTQPDGNPRGLGLSGFRFVGTCQRDGVRYEGYGGWSWKTYLSTATSCEAAIWVVCNHCKTDVDQHSLWEDPSGALWQLETILEDRLKLTRYQSHTRPKPDTGLLLHKQNASQTQPIEIICSYYAPRNPFFDVEQNRIDFISYCKRNSIPSIDAVYLFLGWNCMWDVFTPGAGPARYFDCTAIVTDARTFLDLLHEQYPRAVVKLLGLQVPSVTGGTGTSYGSNLPYCDDYGVTRFVMELNMAYEALSLEHGYREFVEFVNLSGQFDSENNMPCAERPVNTRSSKTELLGTNGVHPLPEGYLQIADAVYRNAVASFCQGDAATRGHITSEQGKLLSDN